MHQEWRSHARHCLAYLHPENIPVCLRRRASEHGQQTGQVAARVITPSIVQRGYEGLSSLSRMERKQAGDRNAALNRVGCAHPTWPQLPASSPNANSNTLVAMPRQLRKLEDKPATEGAVWHNESDTTVYAPFHGRCA